MIRLTEIRVPLDHAPEALRAAVVARLGVADGDVREVRVFRRAHDARRKAAIMFSYTLDVAVEDEAARSAPRPSSSSRSCSGPTRVAWV